MSWKLPKQWRERVAPRRPQVEFRGFGLPARLAALAGCVGIGARVIDVGTDHGLLPIALVGSGRAEYVIASDLRPEPLRVAKQNVARFDKQDRVELRLGQGLSVLRGAEVDTVTIAGMSGEGMGDILLERDLQELEIRRIIVQPNSQHLELRARMASAGWEITHERIVACGQRCYVLMVFEEAEEPVALSREDAFLGPVLRTNANDPLYRMWLDIMAKVVRTKIEGLEAGGCEGQELANARDLLGNILDLGGFKS